MMRINPKEKVGEDLLRAIDEKIDRPGLRETPQRFAKALDHWFSGYKEDPKKILKTFEDGAEGCDQMVVQLDIPIWSHCEHHIAPFFGVAHVGYIPNKRIVGLSKISRLCDIFARRLQVQERLGNQIADAFTEHLQPLGVGVQLICRHTCMESRGIQKAGTATITSALRGVFLSDPSVKAEFLALARTRLTP